MTKQIFTTQALNKLYPNKKWRIPTSGGDINLSDIIKEDNFDIDEEAVNTEVDKLQAEHDVQEYARNRQAEYPNWGSQLNKIYDDGVTKWKSEMVDPIKAKWPKDNSGPK